MRVGVYIRGGIEDLYRDVDISKLTCGSSIREALKQLGITSSNFSRGFLELTDKETEITVKFPYKDYLEFERVLWYIRQKMLKKRRG